MATTTWSDLENRDGVRFSFNCWPDDRQSASKCVVPLGALVTPLKPIAEVPVRVVEN
jgi:protein transport protein SEC23